MLKMPFKEIYRGKEPMRINKLLAGEGICSRREAEALMDNGQILVDGEIVRVGYKIQNGQTIEILPAGGHALQNKYSIVYHKPIGIVSGQPEKGQVPAIRMINKSNFFGESGEIPVRDTRIPPAGRLDKDSRGLLILSQDGVVSKAIIGPDSDLEKEYIVKVKGYLNEVKLRLLTHGLELDGRQLKPAKIDRLTENSFNIILKEGRNRQIRRMCELLDLKVIDLFRVRIGSILLDDLPEGKWRHLSDNEKRALLGR